MKRVLAILAFAVWIPLSTHPNEGQRNAGMAPDQLGNVHFPSSCSPVADDPVRPTIDKTMGCLRRVRRGLSGSWQTAALAALRNSAKGRQAAPD